MTKAKQTETAISRIENKINSMNNSQDLTVLEYYDSAICAMIYLSWRLEIITKEERQRLEGLQCDEYLRLKAALKAKAQEGGTAA